MAHTLIRREEVTEEERVLLTAAFAHNFPEGRIINWENQVWDRFVIIRRAVQAHFITDG